VATSIKQLVELGLLKAAGPDLDRWLVVSPQTARVERLAPLEDEVRERERTLAEMSDELDSFTSAYLTGLRDRDVGQTYEVLTDLESIRAVISSLAAACRHEVLTVQPGGPRRVEILAEAAIRDRTMLSRGVSMRTLYQHTVRFSPETLAHVREMSALGAQVRTLDALPPRLIVFDRDVAVIPDPTDVANAVVVRAAPVVEFLASVFGLLWDAAEPLALPGEDADRVRKASADIDRAIIRLLVTGAKDEVIARRLGTSLRTCRRRIGLVMEQLGAASRFQAGFLVHRLGVVEADADEVGADEADERERCG
jgi:DNA-binding CsgD family transcriptional regulator